MRRGLTASRLLKMVPAEVHHAVAFLVDAEALTHSDRPILVINLFDYVEGLDNGEGPQYGATFRVVPSEMWSVQNNLTISNMDWAEFAENVDSDGIFRGFE
jgi:succinylarginine dihydrolase